MFLTMKLRPDQGVQDVEPVKVTYPSSGPMIPLRLTAVAAHPNMAVMTWIYADRQAVPVNYAKMDIANEELIFFGRGERYNYRQLMSQKADECRDRRSHAPKRSHRPAQRLIARR